MQYEKYIDVPRINIAWVDTMVNNLPTVNITRVTVLNDKFNWKTLTDWGCCLVYLQSYINFSWSDRKEEMSCIEMIPTQFFSNQLTMMFWLQFNIINWRTLSLLYSPALTNLRTKLFTTIRCYGFIVFDSIYCWSHILKWI